MDYEVSCYENAFKIDLDYLKAVWSPIYGNCFNIFAADESFGKSSLTGASYGLSLELQVVIIKTLPVSFKVKLERQIS